MLFVKDFLADQQVFRSDRAPQTPLVSVILPTYARYKSGLLQRAVESVLSQTFTDFELLLIDDGSRDGSAEFVERCRLSDPRVIHVRHERNSGLPALRVNEGIELARGQYLAFQFDDDIWLPQALQALIDAIQKLDQLSIVVGQARCVGPTSNSVLPEVALNVTNLYEQNRLANNSVLLPRAVIERYGMYDCHIAMRRLCDWDLWLRYIQQVPFVGLDEIVSEAYEGTPNALGVTVPWDLSLFRYIHGITRTPLLTPQHWREYPVDSLGIGAVDFPLGLARRIYEDHIVPYYLKFRHRFPQIEGFRATFPRPVRNAVFTKRYHDISEDVTFHQYDAIANQRQSYKSHFQVVTQMSDSWMNEADMLMLVRVVEPQGIPLLTAALHANRPVAYALDDDLLTMYEYGPQFAYLAPGTPNYETVVELLKGVDAVWVTNEFIAESVLPYNPRLIPYLGCTSPEWLPDRSPRRNPDRPMKIGYVGTNYRIEEFSLLWDAFRQVAEEFRGRVTFEFWGLDLESLPPLDAPTKSVPFSASYFEYLKRLRENEFDILITPLLDHPRPRLGKSLIKYYETAVAGALGIFSDVPQYAPLPGGQTCLKAKNTVTDWLEVLREAIMMPAVDFDRMRAACIQHVRENYTSAAQIDKYEAAWRAVEFHARTRQKRYPDGRPRIVYIVHSAHMAGGEIQLWRRLHMMRSYGVEPVVVLPAVVQHMPEGIRIREEMDKKGVQVAFVSYTCMTSPLSPEEFTSSEELESVCAFLEKVQPALVHSVTFVPSFGQACQRLAIPHIASLYAIEDEFRWGGKSVDYRHCVLNQSDSIYYARRWASLLDSEWFCAREVAPQDFFSLGFTRSLESRACRGSGSVRIVLTGTVQERKRQAEAIEAVGRLRQEGIDCHLDLYGYTHFFPNYYQHCLDLIGKFNLQDRVSFRGFTSEVVKVLQEAEVLLSPSTFESFPSAIKEAMAAGVLVVATPVGGISELIVDGETGILCADVSVGSLMEGLRRAATLPEEESQRIVEAARRVARIELHPDRAVNDLFSMYLRALELHSPATDPSPQVPASPANLSISSSREMRNVVMETVGDPPVGYEPVIGTLRYRIAPRLPRLKEIRIMMGTTLPEVIGRLFFRICLESGSVLREGECLVTLRIGTDWVALGFPEIAHSDGQRLTLELWLQESQSAKMELTDTPSSKGILNFRRLQELQSVKIGLFETHHKRSRIRRAARVAGVSPVRDDLFLQFVYAQ